MKAMETLQDLIEEAKLRTVWWALCIFAVSYFLTHTSKSMWMNVPMAVLLVSGLRLLLNEVEFSWKIRKQRPLSYLSHLEKKQLSVNDSRLSTSQPPPKWKRKIDSPTVEAAMQDFINKVLQDFVVDLWYADITPDKEAPQLINAVIMDVLGEISARVKEINLVDLLTRDVVDLIGDHIELFRRNHIAIGMDVMGMLSSEERDERLKHHLMASKDLHPALISPDCEYKVLQRIMGGVLAIVLKPREAQCPLVRCIAREILTCLIMQPVMDFACPEYINELLECIFLATMNEPGKEVGDDHTAASDFVRSNDSPSVRDESSYGQKSDMSLSRLSDQREVSSDPWGNVFSGPTQDDQMHHRPADWARILEAATQRRTEVLMPENLENMWTKGRNYKKKIQKNAARGLQTPITKGSGTTVTTTKDLKLETPASMEDQSSAQTPVKTSPDALLRDQNLDAPLLSDLRDGPILDRGATADELGLNTSLIRSRSKNRLKRSNSTSDLKVQTQMETSYPSEVNGPIIPEYYSATVSRSNEVHNVRSVSDKVLRIEGHIPKLKCRVLGAYFEKLGSKSFAVYSIAVTDADNNTWFVKRRYRNFERLHRLLKDIPNYTLHLPPKRIFSSSTEDAFVHQRCIQLDKYLRDLLSIANVAEQHEVWDFLSVSSKNYSFGKSSSVMRTLAVNVDDAVDDIVRQFKGVSDGLMRKVVGPSSSSYEASSVPGRNLSWKSDEMNNMALGQAMLESANSYSDNEVGDKDGNHDHDVMDSTAQANGWHSDNELNSKGFPPRVVKRDELLGGLGSEKKIGSGVRSEILSLAANFPTVSDQLEDPLGVPAEWTPPNVSVPLLNLVDKIFQLKRRGWLRRQVFWISKQILQLMMEDAIDDWLVGQIHWLRREDTVALGIRWIQDLLWPGGTFFRRLNAQHEGDASQTNQRSPESSVHSAGSKVTKQGSFEQQLEAARRASEVKKMIFDGAPSTLVSLIGHKQYKRCARDIYYFLQSTICLKQLAYALLELVLITVLPELRDVIADVHERMPTQSV